MHPPDHAGKRLGAAIADAVKRMSKDARKELAAIFEDAPAAQMGAAQDGVSDRSGFVIHLLKNRWARVFEDIARRSVSEMAASVLLASDSGIRRNIEQLTESLTIDTRFQNERLKEVLDASTQQAASLITRIPERFLEDVGEQTMRSITSGRGMQDLVPYLENRYEGDIKWARHVAMDQTRKTFASVNETQFRAMGVEEYEWVHTQGGRYPREWHKHELNGKIFRWDDPPWIDPPGTKNRQKGHPGTAIFCRCIAKPVFSFLKKKEQSHAA